ncbi:MAG: HEAT repeat domain-containing protein [Proteobacteria bacterium]|nr:HEAT repeat domain-containing protein [Pseudomonadota bacterium]MCP4919077.1 HEAT repeat domain-containing protein [Pseudomonadota bacterium]
MLSLLVSLALAQDTQVLDLLNQHDSPPTATDWQSIEGVDAQLVLAIQGDLNTTQKGRAVQALGYVPTDAGRAELSRVLAEDPVLARKAVFALAIGWGDAALPELKTALESDDVQLRIAAVKATTKVPLGTELLQSRMEVEQDEAVRDALTKALGGAQ